MWVQNGDCKSKLIFLALIFNSVASQNTDGTVGNIDLEKVRKAVIDPSTISNQITGTVLNEIFVNTGYIIGGKFLFLTQCLKVTKICPIFEFSRIISNIFGKFTRCPNKFWTGI